MADRSPGSELEDPLEGYSGLSLFPRTFNSVPNPPRPYEPDDLQYTHNFLKSMPLKSPDKLLEQAKAIIGGSSELLNSEVPNNIGSDKNEALAAKVVENVQERRPGLDRKRARFSLKPSISQPSVSIEPSLDIGKLKDPEEFFLAYEKFENAQREWQKQTGGILTDRNQNSQLTRSRRPGMFGKRSVKYKHRYSTDAPSQDIIEEEILSPSSNSLQQETTNPNVTSQERELAGSIAKTEKKVNELLDELLAGSYEELDGDGAINLLQEHLQIKPIKLEKLSLPDMEDVPSIDFNASVANLPKPKPALPDIHNLIKEISSRTPAKKRLAESSAHSLASPTPPKSILASIPLLKKRILQSTPSNDPFSALNMDESPATDASPAVNINKQSDQVDAGEGLSISCKMKSPVIEENDTVIGDAFSFDVVIRDFSGPSDKSTGVHVGSSGYHSDNGNDGSSCVDDTVIHGNLSRLHDADLHAVEPNALDDNVGDMLEEAMGSAKPDLGMEDSILENSNHIQSQLDKPEPSAVKDSADEGLEQQNERVENKQTKRTSRPCKDRESKALSRRQSLAAAGTSWKSGVRRSTRIRSRPLEYWKGERFLYGRIHESLATVIGIKYESPTTTKKAAGKPNLKVKSFVSDKYKDLVELAALH